MSVTTSKYVALRWQGGVQVMSRHLPPLVREPHVTDSS